MFQRPKPGETEEDLLKQQDEFLKASGKQSAPEKSSTEGFKEQPQKQGDVIGDIFEKNVQSFMKPSVSSNPGESFPKPFKIDLSVTKKREKKSLFALQMEKNQRPSNVENVVKFNNRLNNVAIENDKTKKEIQKPIEMGSSILTGLKSEEIHEENVNILSKMTEAEILAEQKKLKETLDPKLIEFLKSLKHKKGESGVKSSNMEIFNSNLNNEVAEAVNVQENVMEQENTGKEKDKDVMLKLSHYLDEKWVEMDFIEKEKLEWIGDIPDAKCLEPDQEYSARFDFKGELQPFKSEIDVTKSLHHHGDEPERPGYTIQELYQLSRSTVLQQRILALNTLANIIRKTKLGYYDNCFDGFLLHKLIESDFFFLLRFSVDENSLIPVTMNCLQQLFECRTDELCLDKLLGTTDMDEQPELFILPEVTEEEEKELKDHVLIGCDLVKGVLRTDLLMRLSYILNNLNPTRETTVSVIQTLIRISRHSLEASRSIIKTPNLLNFIYTSIKMRKPIYQGIKLFRILISHSKEIAWSLNQNYSMKFLLEFLDSDTDLELTKAELYHLKLESAYLWRSFLHFGLMVEEFNSWTVCLVRLLRFFLEKVDFSDKNEFDFELFSSLVSLMGTCVRTKIPVSSIFFEILSLCLEKGLKQLFQAGEYSYTSLKALGSIFRFFSAYFKVNGVVDSDLDFIKKINRLLSSILSSNLLEVLSSGLSNYSYILSMTNVERDPKNLPSLCSISHGGRDYLRIIQTRSPLPFFSSLVQYLFCTYSITFEVKDNISLLFENSGIRKYIDRICKTKLRKEWFTRFEKDLLVGLLELYLIQGSEDTLKLGFHLFPGLRTDDKNALRVLDVICNNTGWKSKDESFFSSLKKMFKEIIVKGDERPGLTILYNQELVPEEWMYKPIHVLKGSEETSEVTNTLRFLTLILNENSSLLKVPHSLRYHELCTVFLTDSNVFDPEVQKYLEINFSDIISNRNKISLDKAFYDLYTELVTQYAGMSYGAELFAKFVMFPLQNCFDVSFRKLLWFEYLHVLRVVTLGFPLDGYLDLKNFLEPCESDESLLVNYLNSISNNVITKTRNPFVYQIAFWNVKKYMQSENVNNKLLQFLCKKVLEIKNEDLRSELLS